MTRAVKMMSMAALLVGGLLVTQATAQQVVSGPVVQPVPATVRTAQPTRQYRSFSVNPARGDVRRNGAHSGDATWRHAGAKGAGHYATGK